MFLRAARWIATTLLVLALHSPARGAPEPRIPVLIIGGGVAGMATAWHLQKAGIEFQLLEMSPRLGGRMRTASYPDSGTAEIGLEEFWEGNPLLEIMRELKLPLEKSASSFSSVVLDGRIHAFTQETNTDFLRSVLSGDELRSFQAWDAEAGRIQERLRKPPLPADLLSLKDQSFEAWVTQKKFGLSKKAQQFIRQQSEPEYGTSWTRISALDGIAEWRIFQGKGMQSFHLVRGNQTLAEAMAEHLGRSRILLNTQVTNIQSRSDHVEVIATNTATSEQKIFRAEHVVSTIPLFRLNEIQFSPELSTRRQEAIQTQGWGSYFTAHVFVDRAAERFWNALGPETLPILTGSSIGVVYEGYSPQTAGYRLLNLLITGDFGEAFNARTISFDAVGGQIRAGFEKLWPGFSKHIQRMTFYRYHPRAIAGWPVGRSRFDTLSELMRTPEGRLYFAGDFTEGTHSDDAARSALRVVGQIVESRKKR